MLVFGSVCTWQVLVQGTKSVSTWYQARRGSKFATDLPPLAVALWHWTRPHPEHWIIPIGISNNMLYRVFFSHWKS